MDSETLKENGVVGVSYTFARVPSVLSPSDLRVGKDVERENWKGYQGRRDYPGVPDP